MKKYFSVCVLAFIACQSQRMATSEVDINEPLKFNVVAAPEWTDLFYRKSGWFGADGIFSIPLDGNDFRTSNEKTLLIFSDTYIGEVEGIIPKPGNTMVNNTMALVQGREPTADSIIFQINHAENGQPKSFFAPNTSTTGNDQYFWLGDGFVNKDSGDNLYLFAYHVEKTGPNVFDFIEPSVSLLRIPAGNPPQFSNYKQIPTPLHLDLGQIGKGNLGAGILVNTKWAGATNPDGYAYVYGCFGQDKNLVCARVKTNHFEDFTKWTYYTGSRWSKDAGDMGIICNAASNELSVTPLPDGRFLLTFQVLGLSDKVGIRIGSSPVGPFSEIQEIWKTPEYDEGLLPYNAKAHPALSKPGELLISYNTITFDFWKDIQKNAHIYRPRFIKMIFE